MSSEARTGHLVEHFQDLPQQEHAARLGMWLFLATEILLFGGLFVGYSVYRFAHPDVFKICSEHLPLWSGTAMTVVLITSSFTVASSLHFAKHGQRRAALVCLALTLLLALSFLCIKGWEYYEHFKEGALPGKFYHFEEVKLSSASLFYTIYWLATALHGIHVTVGMIVLGVMTWRTARGDIARGYPLPLDLAALYWHLVDLVWIFLYPLLYLV